MKRSIKSMAMSVGMMLTLSSCSSWYQIATIASRDVEMKDSGAFVSNTDVLSISYDFWSENGNLSFYVTNHSDSDIYLDLSRSYYIWNGKVFDYFKNRTYVSTSAVSSGTSRSVTSGSGRTSQTMTSSGTAAISNVIESAAYASGKSTFVSASANASNMQAVSYSYMVEYSEAKIVAIPARSFRPFGEYNVAIGGEYRQCGFIRDPHGKEVSILKFEEDNSPVVFENRLMFVIDGVDVPVNNIFYISELRNVNSSDVLKYVNVKSCSGQTMRGVVKHNIFSAPNRFYIRYSVTDGETGRTRK